MSQDSRSQQHAMRFSHAELILVNNAINEILHGPEAIGEAEFHSRIGVSVELAQALLSRIGEALNSESSDTLGR